VLTSNGMPGSAPSGLACVAATAIAAAGCASASTPIATSPSAGLCVPGDSVASVTERFRPPIEELSRRIHDVSGREGYYARSALLAAAGDRDRLLVELLRRDDALGRCVLVGSPRDAALWRSALTIAAVARGEEPSAPGTPVAVTDVRLPPRAFPFVDRACSGHGLEGAAQCLVLLLPAGLGDLATLPAGTWFYAGRTDEARLALADLPVRSDLVSPIEALVARRTREGVARAVASAEAPGPPDVTSASPDAGGAPGP
jgi:hypothetical protein